MKEHTKYDDVMVKMLTNYILPHRTNTYKLHQDVRESCDWSLLFMFGGNCEYAPSFSPENAAHLIQFKCTRYSRDDLRLSRRIYSVSKFYFRIILRDTWRENFIIFLHCWRQQKDLSGICMNLHIREQRSNALPVPPVTR